jgi:polyisoprenoid-binding protein YceI
VDKRDDQKRSPLRWIKWVVIGVVAVVALGYGAIFLYTEVLNDSPDALSTEDLDAALSATAPTAAADSAATTAASAPATTAPTTAGGSATTAPAASSDGVDGPWNATAASELGYRVDEVLFGVNNAAVGRTHQVTGSLTISGTTVADAEFVVDMKTITSDESRRDDQFNGRIMSTDEFPTATFTLTSPIELGSIPAEGEQVTATATGDLTLRGVTQPVTFDVTAQLEGGRIGVLGSIPIVFADYSIPNPSFGGIDTEDHGVIEFVLVFEQA